MVRNTIVEELGNMELINEMYSRQNKTQAEIAEVMNFSKTTISEKMDKFDIESGYNGSVHPSFSYSHGYYTASARTLEGRKSFYIHRLTAYAHFDGEIKDFENKQVHHRTKHMSDNRPENLEVLSGQQHQAVHHMNEWVKDSGWPVLLSPRYAE